MLIDGFLGQKRGRFAVSEITRRRTDQFGNLMTMLKFSTIDLDESSRVSKQNFSRRFDDSCLAGSRGTQKQQVANRTSRHSHARQVNLVHVHDPTDRAVLADDLSQKPTFKVKDFRTPHLGI